MTQRQYIRTSALKALRRCDGVPMPEESLVSAVQILVRPEPGATDVRAELKEMEAEGFIASHHDGFTGKSFTLTERGEHKAKQL